jgi:hypothetical protein
VRLAVRRDGVVRGALPARVEIVVMSVCDAVSSTEMSAGTFAV